MQVGVDVTCIHTNFGGQGLCGFRDIATLKNSKFSLSDHGWSVGFCPWLVSVHGCEKV